MPVRNFNTMSFRIPRRLGLEMPRNGMVKDEESMKQYLPYVDVQSGLRGRLILRDPISGLGDLPAESDPLKGNRLRSKPQTQWEQQTRRNPILLEGDLGEEYNCLYTTKPLTCKPRNNRNIITLQGDLGEELDPINPESNNHRRSFRRNVQRDPIAGVGEFGPREWDPIWKEHGKLRLNRLEQMKRDPITHAVPLENMGEKQEKNLVRYYPEKINKEDPINHTINGEAIIQPQRFSLRMFQEKMNSSDPIRHTISAGTYNHLLDEKAEIHCGRRSLNYHNENKKRRNPITHETFEDPHSNNANGIADTLPNRSYILGEHVNGHNYASNPVEKWETSHTRLRNPISGEGIHPRDYVDLLKIPGGTYSFRNLAAAPSKSKTSSAITSPKQESAVKKVVKAMSPPGSSANSKK